MFSCAGHSFSEKTEEKPPMYTTVCIICNQISVKKCYDKSKMSCESTARLLLKMAEYNNDSFACRSPESLLSNDVF